MNRYLRLVTALTIALFSLEAHLSLAQAELDEQQSTVLARMHEQLTVISTIKFAVVAGKLEDVREPATSIADHETVAGLPADFGPYVAQMRTYARHVIEAESLNSAAASVSNLAKTCGDCHSANGIQLEFGYDRLPREDVEDVVTHMQRHQWATDRLWEGLIGPSDAAWNRGVDMLIDVPLLPSDVTTATEHAEEIGNIVGRIHALGSTGSEKVTPDGRSELYAEVLGLCAACHTLLSRGPAH